jgi:tRNA (guanine26-N2/guanine27-N2)-dimethyltransferase
MAEIREGRAAVSIPKGVFYNPEMELCRDIFSLCIGCLPGKLSVADVMCASGVRGIRYAAENRNISSLSLSDLSVKAVACARRNASRNNVKCRITRADACDFLSENSFGVVELDPFGTPQPFLNAAARSLSMEKNGFLSVTATDMAVLCGAQRAACFKNYAAAPLDNEFCHENAARMLIGAIAREFGPHNLSVRPLFSFSHRHYVKLMLEVKRGAGAAAACVKGLGFVSYCQKCCFREARKIPLRESCPYCGSGMEFAGPLYTGALWDGRLVEKMLKENAARGYGNSAKIEGLLLTMLEESAIPSYGYYDLHVLAKRMSGRILPIDEMVARLRAAGFSASRTHFCPTAVRTDAPHEFVVGLARRD